MKGILTEIRPREEELKNKWKGVADNIPVNPSQYSFDSAEREDEFIRAQFNTEGERIRYKWYREEWYRRPKEQDPGNIPLAVCCELVSVCNLGCSMCYTRTEEFQNAVVGTQRMMPWKTVTAIIDECAELGVPSMLFSWRGESTLYSSRHNGRIYRFADALAYARKKGILEITSLTHGQTIDEEMAGAIVDAEPSWLSISVDGLEDTYNKVRTSPNRKGTGYNAFATVINNIKRLVDIRNARGKSRPQIRVNTVYPMIASREQEYHDLMKSIGVGWVTVNEILDFRGTGMDADDLPEEAIIADWGCQYPFQRLTVSANGMILPCTGAHNEESTLVLGRYKGSSSKTVRDSNGMLVKRDVPEMTLYEAWHCDKINNIRSMHVQNKRKLIRPGCRNCRHGAVKHGVEWIPDDWDMEKMQWTGKKWRNG